ncbi:carbohydrate porin [Oscillatoria amoena NRMC-F 0135]|nr:carbohydrate porin [Oscillatoria amoena NRMC-F 0135]
MNQFFIPLLTLCLFASPILIPNAISHESLSTRAQNIWTHGHLLGDWGGTRAQWQDKGFDFELAYTAEGWAFASGGENQAFLYQGLFEIALEFDFQKMIGWSGGSMRVNTLIPHNSDTDSGGPGRYTGSGYDSSNISAYETVRLYELWLQQEALDGKLSLRVGQLAADDEFFISDTAGLFLGGTFDWGNNLASNLPNGGPAYPVAGLGTRLKIQPMEQFYLMSAVFEGDVGDQAGNNKHGVDFNLDDDGILIINEIGFLLNQEENATGLPGSYKLGGWVHTGRFESFRFDETGLFLDDPARDGDGDGEPDSGPGFTRGTWGLYLIADQMVYRPVKDSDQGLSLFWRIAGGPDKTSTVSLYTDMGAAYKGLIPGRRQDVLGIALAMQNYSDIFNDRIRDFNGDPANPTNRLIDTESMIELTYQINLAPWWYVQPTLQYIINPAGELTPPDRETRIPNAFAVGVRSGIVF